MSTFISLELYNYTARKSTSKPRDEVKVCAIEGKIPLKEFMAQRRLESTYLWEGEDVVELYPDECGLSIVTFEYGKTYKVKTKATQKIDRAVSFSLAGESEVFDDFGLTEEKPWTIQMTSESKIPAQLSHTLSLLGKLHTLRVENSRRTIIQLLLLYAIDEVDKGQFLFLDEELSVSTTREVEKTGSVERVTYKGPLDFVIGHSRKFEKMENDTGLLIVEAKRDCTFEKGLVQVVAQAATLLCLRRNNKRGHGDRRTYWIYADGGRWQIGYVRPEGDGIVFGKTDVINVSIKPFKEDEINKIFSLLIFVISEAYKSTPRNSAVVQADEDPDVDVNTLETLLSSGLDLNK